MKITFDPVKGVLNRQKHGVSLADADYFEWHTAVVWSDNRRDYGENRSVALGYMANGYTYSSLLSETSKPVSSVCARLTAARLNDMPKLKEGTIIPTAAEDAVITTAAQADPDARPFTEEEWAEVQPTVKVGRPRAAVTKERITIRLSPDVLAQFRATGSGWQTRIDAALRDWLQNNVVEQQEL
jgi:uncharacterized protein (DUF4415 family)